MPRSEDPDRGPRNEDRPDGLIPRLITPRLLEALQNSRAVGLLGPRQVGKTTLARRLIRDRFPASYVTLDDEATRSAAADDPTGFVAGLTTPAIIDEIQREPRLMLALKQRLDGSDRRGQFLITGSANVVMMPTIRDALPGRIEYVRIAPLAAAEMEVTDGALVDRLFAGGVPQLTERPVGRAVYAPRIAAGGFPDALRRSARSRRSFFEAYIDSIIGRDVPDLARLRDPHALGRLLRIVAARSATLLSGRALSQQLGVDHKTVERHLEILSELMLVQTHPAWRKSLSSREIKSPKIYVADTGLLTGLIGADEGRIARDDELAGRAFETFAVTELVKLASWSEASPQVMHYRDRDGREVDVVLERADGDIVGLEIKAAATVGSRDFRGLAHLRERTGAAFRAGVVLHTGSTTVPFGDRLWALPLSALWE